MQALKKCLGVDLGSNTVKVVELALDKTGVRVLNAAYAETNIDPSAPAADRRKAIASTLKQLLKKNRFSTRKAVFALPGQKVFIRRFRLPETTPERLERIVSYEARQQIPFPLDQTDLQFEFFPIPEDKEVEILLVAVRRDEVTEYMKLVDQTGLSPVAVGVSSFSLFNAHTFLGRSAQDVRRELSRKAGRKGGLLPIGRKKKGAEPGEDEDGDDGMGEFAMEEVKAFVNIGASAIDLVIASLGAQPLLKFPRTVPLAGNEITRSIMDRCEVSSFLDAERIKKTQTRLMTFEFEFEEDGNVNHDACTAATQTVDRLVTELRRSLDFFISQPDGMAVDQIVISGGQAALPGLDSYIEEKLTVPTTMMVEPPEESAVAWANEETPMSMCLGAMGLALQGIGLGRVHVDFLPQERKITRDFPYRSAAVMAALVAGTVFLSAQAGNQYINAYQRELDGLRMTERQNRSQTDELSRVQNLHNDVARMFEEFSEAVPQRSYWVDYLARLAALKPPEVVMQQVVLEHDGRVIIVGLSETERSAADFAEALLESLPLQDEERLPIRAIAQTRAEGFEGNVFRFQLEVKLTDKFNALEITPTPDPATLQGGGGTRGGAAPRPPGRGGGRF